MKTTAVLVRFVVLLILVSSAIRLKGQGSIQIIAQPPTRVTDCDTGLLVGSGYVAELMGAPEGTTDRNLFVRLGVAAPIVNGALPFSGNLTIPGFPGSSFLLFASAWETAGARVGQSAIVSVQVGPLTPPIPLTSQVRIPDFQVCPVPEPSTIALGVLAVGVLLLYRHRSQA